MTTADFPYQTSPRTRKICVGILVLATTLVLYPFQTETAPEWTLRVVDNFGSSVAGINVTQHWQHYLLESEAHEEFQKSDAEGRVSFPERNIRASIARRTISLLARLVREGTTARLDARASVVVWGSRDHETSVAVYQPADLPPAEVVVHRLRRSY